MIRFIKRKIQAFAIHIVRRSSYTTDDRTRQEFEEFLSWYRTEIGRAPFTQVAIKKVTESYFKDKNIALLGVKRLEGAYDRKPIKELILALCATAIGLALAIIIYRYYA